MTFCQLNPSKQNAMKTLPAILSIVFFALLFAKAPIPVKASNDIIPFRLVGKLIVVQANVNGQAGNFILDTGVPELVLNARYFKGRPSDHKFVGINGQVQKVRIDYAKVMIGRNIWKNVYAEVIPMTLLEDAKGVPIHGLIGSQLFGNYIILIDIQKRQLELYPLDRKGENANFKQLFHPTESLAFRYKGGAPLIGVQHGIKTLKLTIDTGAEMNLMDINHRYEANISGNTSSLENVGGIGTRGIKVMAVQMSDVQIGMLPCQPMKTAFVNLDYLNASFYGPKADGILGYEFLKQFKVAINFKKRQVYIRDIEEFNDAVLLNKQKKK